MDVEELRVRIETVKCGSAMKAARIGAPMWPPAPTLEIGKKLASNSGEFEWTEGFVQIFEAYRLKRYLKQE